MAEDLEYCSKCGRKITKNKYKLGDKFYCDDCIGELLERSEASLGKDEDKVFLNERYPKDSDKLLRILLASAKQEKYLKVIKNILVYFLVVSILGIVGGIIIALSGL